MLLDDAGQLLDRACRRECLLYRAQHIQRDVDKVGANRVTQSGDPLTPQKNVLIIDDVISAGTSVRESVELIRAAGAVPAAVAIALDRMERGTGALSAVQEVRASYNIPVISIATLDDLMAYLKAEPQYARHLAAVGRYREQYGVTVRA